MKEKEKEMFIELSQRISAFKESEIIKESEVLHPLYRNNSFNLANSNLSEIIYDYLKRKMKGFKAK